METIKLNEVSQSKNKWGSFEILCQSGIITTTHYHLSCCSVSIKFCLPSENNVSSSK